LLIKTSAANVEGLKKEILELSERSKIFATDLLASRPLVSFCGTRPGYFSDFTLGKSDLLDVVNSSDLETLQRKLSSPVKANVERKVAFEEQFGHVLPHVRTWHIVDGYAWENLTRTSSGISNLLGWLCEASVPEIVIYTETMAPNKVTKGPPLTDLTMAAAKIRLAQIKGDSQSKIEMKILQSNPPGVLHDRFFMLDFDLGAQCVIAGSGAENYSEKKKKQSHTSYPSTDEGFAESKAKFASLKDNNIVAV
jgi:hypothetical protein